MLEKEASSTPAPTLKSERKSRSAATLFQSALVAGVMLMTGSGDAWAQDTNELRYAYSGPKEVYQGVAADIFEETLEKVSDGRLTIQQFPASQLGNEDELLEDVRRQNIAFVNASAGNVAAIAPQSGVLLLHYVFESQQHQERALQDPAVIEAYTEMFEDSVDDVRVVALYTGPFRNMYGSDEIRSVDDIQDKKIRVQASRTEDKTYAEYGAQTVHMPFPELYGALQTGVVDLGEVDIAFYTLENHYEVAPIMSMTEHTASTQVILLAESYWEQLSEQEKGWVDEAANAVSQRAIPAAWEMEDELRKEYEKLGVKFVDEVDKESFMKIAKPLQDRFASELGPDAERLLELIRDVR